MCGGRISSPNAAEVVVVTFSGCVYGLTRGHGTTTGTVSSEVKAKVESLRLEGESTICIVCTVQCKCV